jgi:hypothetical protein
MKISEDRRVHRTENDRPVRNERVGSTPDSRRHSTQEPVEGLRQGRKAVALPSPLSLRPILEVSSPGLCPPEAVVSDVTIRS